MALPQNKLLSVYEDTGAPDVSDAYRYATGVGGIGLDAYYNNINQFLANNPDEQAIADAMAQYGVSQADVDYAKSLVNNSSAASTTNANNTVVDNTNTGALTQAANTSTNTTDTTGANTGALTQAASNLTGANQTGALSQVSDADSGQDTSFNINNGLAAINPQTLTSQQKSELVNSNVETANAQNQTVDASTTNINKIRDQILAQGTSSKWSGEGFGSAEANATDMAKILAGIGITDINEFGKVTKTGVDTEVRPDGKGGYVDSKGNKVDPSKVQEHSVAGEFGEYTYYTAPVGTQEGYGNVKTGQFVPNTYGERQTDSAWGGTYSGSGNTAYRVDFSRGTPVLYTTGASSNDLVNMFADNPLLGKVVTTAAAYFGGPAGVAALQAAMGKSVEDIAKSALLTYAGGQIAGQIAGSADLVNSIGADATNILAKGVGKYVSSEGKANIIDSFVGNAIDIGIGQITDIIPEFKDLTSGQQDFTRNVIKTAIQNGGDLSLSDLVDAAITAGTAAAKASASGTINQAINADKTINDAVNSELNKALTFDATGSADVNAAMEAADAAGYGKFTFGGKTYTIDNNNAANTIKELEADALATNTANNLKGGEFEGVDAAVAANAAKNNTVIGNTEADTLEEAAALARSRNPTGTTFTYGGNTYTLGASSTALDNEIASVRQAEVLDNIKNAKTFNEAFATARAGLGAGKTFTWQGKEYSTATAEERPDLATSSIDAINARNLANVTDASKTVAAQSDTAARATAAEELAKQQAAAAKTTESTGFFSNIAKAIQDQMKLSSEAANDYLKNNPNSPITNSVSTAMEAAGNLQKNVAGGTALLLNNKPLADAFVKSGDDLTKFGQSIGSGVVDTKNWNDTMGLLEKASGWEKLGVMAGRIMDGTSGLGRQVEVELRQELPGLFLGGGTVKGILVATGAMDVAETAGNAALDAYDAAVLKGSTHEQALTDARKAGAAAGMAEAAVQVTLGKVGEVIAGKITNVAGKAGTKIVGETLTEGGQEGGSSLAVNAILGQDLDVNKALTQAVAGAAVGKGTSVATSPADVATTETIKNNITTAVTTGDASTVNSAITSSVQQSLTNGASVETAVGGTVTSAITSGADAGTSITTAVSTAVTSGADVTQTVTSSIDSAITAGADTTTAINSTVTSAITSGADSTVVVNSAVTSAITSGADVTTSVKTAVQAAVTAGADVTTATTSATTAAVTASITSGTDASTAITNSVTAAVTAGADVNTAATTATSAAVTASITSGTDTTTAVTTSVSAAVDAGASVTSATNAAVTAAVTTAVTTGADTTSAINSSVTAAVNAGADTTTAVTTAVTAAVDSSITTAITNGTSVETAITSSVTSSVNSAATTNTSVTSAVDTAVSTAITTAVTNGADVNSAVTSSVTSAITSAVDNNVNTSTAVTTAVDSAVTTSLANNVDANSAITTSVTAAINTTTDTNADTTATSAVNSAVNAAVLSGVDTNTAINAAIDAVVNSNISANINIDDIKKSATDTATTAVEKVDLISSVNELISSTLTATPITSTPTSKTSTAKKSAGLSAGLIGGALMAGELERLPPQMLKSYMTQDKFVDPLAKLHALQEDINTEKMPPQVKTQEPDMPDQGTWKYGTSPDDIDSMFGEEEEAQAFKAGGYVAPLQMASGGAMPLPLLAKSGGALGALPRPDGRMDFRHGAHVAGEGDGQSDDIKAMLADGEFVFPADVVSALGNGSTKAGSDKLYEMMHAIRARARSKKPKDLPPPALKSPLDYLKKVRSK